MSMTKKQEEIKRIDRLKSLIKELKIDTVIAFRISADSREALADDIETVLNMLKEKDKEIEFQKDINNREKNRHKKTEKSLKGQISKKDKIIDLMAKSIELQQYANIDTTNLDLICNKLKCNKKCKLVKEECIKQYFERKSEEC